jgi:hypothetical protein
MKKKLPITIVIPVKDDHRIVRCIDSIDVNADTIVIFNGNYSKNIAQKVRAKHNVTIYTTKYFNFAKFYNMGIKYSQNNHIFYMDSDSIFVPGGLLKLIKLNSKYPIVKGKIKFKYNNMIEKVIAKNREFTTTDHDNLFIPGPIFNKIIFKKTKLFNEKIRFSADYEMWQRIDSLKIKCHYINDVIIIHDPLSITQDLKSAFSYGVGRSQRYLSINKKRKKPFMSDYAKYVSECLKTKGLAVAIYFTIWIFAINIGHYSNDLKVFINNKLEVHNV